MSTSQFFHDRFLFDFPCDISQISRPWHCWCTILVEVSFICKIQALQLVMWAQPHHLATPGLATWRSPGGDQNFLKKGGKRWRKLYYIILASVHFCTDKIFNAHYIQPFHHSKCLKREDIL
jgi:hypothetical protein